MVPGQICSRVQISSRLKKTGMVAGGLILCVAVGLMAAPQSKTFTGSIMDSACAQMGSHEKMKQSKNITSDKDCTLGCVKGGAKFVLYDSSTNTVYQLDNQKTPAKFAGDNVTVTGTLDPSTKAIHVENIKPGA